MKFSIFPETHGFCINTSGANYNPLRDKNEVLMIMFNNAWMQTVWEFIA